MNDLVLPLWRVRWLASVAFVITFLGPPAQAQDPTRSSAGNEEREVTLAELLRYAEGHAPALRAAAARDRYGDAAREGAAPWLEGNPVLEGGIGPRYAGDRQGVDVEASLEQPIEIAGQRGLRVDAARERRRQLHAQHQEVRLNLRNAVVIAYSETGIERERVSVAEQLSQFADEVLATTKRLLAAGDIGIIDLRIAEADAARSRQALIAARSRFAVARIELAELVGWSIASPPLPGALAEPRALPSLDTLRRRRAAHPSLHAAQASIQEAAARAELAGRDAWPDPVLGVKFEREAAFDSPDNYILLGTLGLPIPLWNRNHLERALAAADRSVATEEREGLRYRLRADVARAYEEASSAFERVSLYDSTVLASLGDSLTLLRKAFTAGELSLRDLGVARERFLDAQNDSIDARADYYRASAELEQALGFELPVTTAVTGGHP